MTKLLLIESPGKLKKLGQILGTGWIVKASMGHIRELADDGEDALGFDLEGDMPPARFAIAFAVATLPEAHARVLSSRNCGKLFSK